MQPNESYLQEICRLVKLYKDGLIGQKTLSTALEGKIDLIEDIEVSNIIDSLILDYEYSILNERYVSKFDSIVEEIQDRC
jgi:hypothetical protein